MEHLTNTTENTIPLSREELSAFYTASMLANRDTFQQTLSVFTASINEVLKEQENKYKSLINDMRISHREEITQLTNAINELKNSKQSVVVQTIPANSVTEKPAKRKYRRAKGGVSKTYLKKNRNKIVRSVKKLSCNGHPTGKTYGKAYGLVNQYYNFDIYSISKKYKEDHNIKSGSILDILSYDENAVRMIEDSVNRYLGRA